MALQPIVIDERIKGYHLTCPACQRGMFINTGLGEHPEHTLLRDPEGKVTLTPALDCPFPSCRWTARIAHGVVYDARRRSDSYPHLRG